MRQNNRHWLPCTTWLKSYSRTQAGQDALAAAIVTLMLIPQSLAYAMLAGLPPVTGLYASILPLLAYAIFGTSNTLSVGPVAIISLMTGNILLPLYVPGSAAYAAAALSLALLSGGLLLLMAVLRLGFLTNFLSHPVVSGFVSATGVLITLGQLKHILGIDVSGHNALVLLWQLGREIPHTHWPTLAVGGLSLLTLTLARTHLSGGLRKLGVPTKAAAILSKTGPVLTLLLAVTVVNFFNLEKFGIAVMGNIPQGLPPLTIPDLSLQQMQTLLPGALLISLVGFVESVSIGQTLAAKRRQQIEPNRELTGLGCANLVAAFSGGLPVTGGFSRSVVNFDAGASTPMAGVFSAIGITLAVFFCAPLLRHLPQAVLAATIIVAVLRLVDVRDIIDTWRYSRSDALAMLVTIAGVLTLSIEAGIILGVCLSLILFLKRTSEPHIAVVGQLPGSQHFRNIQRHRVIQSPLALSLRIDESLFFPNARYLEDKIADLIGAYPNVEHVVIMCSAINWIDASALQSLRVINERLHSAGMQLHLAEIKGPVMDQLAKSDFKATLHGKIFMSLYDAMMHVDPLTTKRTLKMRAHSN